ncbi:MAG: hypothetical protein PW735_10070 [Acidobacteriaceae bacterium]|nr:hypothetical protein [Acidobacteriaceae bacterium]
MRVSRRVVWLLVLGWASVLPAQSVSPPDASVGAALRSLALRAGTVFVGQVQRIERRNSVVLIHFSVEQTLQGSAGNEYILREWAGLWPPGQQRYYAGERALLFLRPASAGALSTPVDGAEGVLPVQQPEVAGGAATVDIRRIATRVLRGPQEPLASVANGAISMTEATALIASAGRSLWHEPVRVRLPVPVRIVLSGGGAGGGVSGQSPVRLRDAR